MGHFFVGRIHRLNFGIHVVESRSGLDNFLIVKTKIWVFPFPFSQKVHVHVSVAEFLHVELYRLRHFSFFFLLILISFLRSDREICEIILNCFILHVV